MKPNSGANLDHLQNEDDAHLIGRRDQLVGTVLAGHIEIISRIGMGGMSVVYKAKDMLLNRMVAIKILLPHVAFDPRGIRRFRQEALAVSKLNHPNIIRVYEFQIPEDGQPFLVMDLIEGQGLDEYINKNGPIESRRAVSLLIEVCAGLEHAHKHGVIHRDLKPGNIMLLKDPESKRQVVKIVDFGLAKLLQDEGDATQGLTRTGDIFGSPLYMSPEQCKSESLDARSDVYSLACVMYEILTGLPPLKGKTVLDTIQMQIAQYPVPLAQVNHRIRMVDRLDSVLLKSMAKDPAHRYQSIAEFRHALEDIKGSAPGEGFFDKLKLTFQLQMQQLKSRPESRFKIALLLSAVLTVVIATTIPIINIASTNHNQMQQSASFDPGRSEQEWLALDNKGQRLFNQGLYGQAEVEFVKELEIAQHLDPKFEKASLEGLLSARYARNEPINAEWSKRLGAVNATIFDTASTTIDLLNTQDAKQARETILKSLTLAVVLTNSQRAWVANKLLNVAIDVGKRFLDPDDELIAQCKRQQASIARVQAWAGDPELVLRKEVVDIYQRREIAFANATKKAATNGQQNVAALAHAQMDLADIYLRKKDYAQAKIWFSKAVKTFTDLPGDYDEETARCQCDLATCVKETSHDNTERAKLLSASEEKLKKLSGTIGIDTNSPELLKAENWILWADLERVKDFSVAHEKLTGKSTPNTKTEELKIKEKTIEYLSNAAASALSGSEKPYPKILFLEETIAKEWMELKSYKAALPRHLHCLAIRITLAEELHDQLATLERIYDCYVGLGDDRQALQYSSKLVNAGQKQYNTYLAHSCLKLKMDARAALKNALEGLQYVSRRGNQIVNHQPDTEVTDANIVNEEDDQIPAGGFANLRAILRLAYAELVVAEAFAATGDSDSSRKYIAEANKFLIPKTAEDLKKYQLFQDLRLFHDAQDLSRQVERQLSSKH